MSKKEEVLTIEEEDQLKGRRDVLNQFIETLQGITDEQLKTLSLSGIVAFKIDPDDENRNITGSLVGNSEDLITSFEGFIGHNPQFPLMVDIADKRYKMLNIDLEKVVDEMMNVPQIDELFGKLLAASAEA